MKLSKKLKENKKLYNYIENKLRGNKDAYMGEGTDVKLILNDKKKLINAFISRNKGLQHEYNELKAENQNFYNFYKNILDYRDNQEYLLKQFKDNITYYQKKGYKIPNLTTKSNIIKYSPLLMEGQEHINKFYLQDLYSLNKRLKKIWPYNKIQKYCLENNINFNKNSEEEDDDNEKEGINSNLFLKKSDLVAKTAFKEQKNKRIYKSLDVSNWFKQYLYADPFLTQGNSIYNDSIFDIDNNDRKNILNKEIERLNNYNERLKENLSKIDNVDNDYIRTDTSKRHSVFVLKLNQNENKNIFQLSSNYNRRSKNKKLSLPHKAKNNRRFEEFYKNIISNKNKKEKDKNIKFINSEKEKQCTLSSPKNNLYKKRNIKKFKGDLVKNNKSAKTINNIFKLDNIENIDKYKKKFEVYSEKEPKALFSLINDVKEPFNRPNIINIFSKKFKLSKIKEIKSKYGFLEKYLCKGLISNNFLG